MAKNPVVDWNAALRRFPGQTNKEKIELLRQEHTWVGIGRMLGVQGQTVSKYYQRLLTKKPTIQPVPRVRNVKRIDYLKELTAFMATPEGAKVRKYNHALQLRNKNSR